jgi:hypothetical protein
MIAWGASKMQHSEGCSILLNAESDCLRFAAG